MTIEEALALAAESQTKGSYVLDKADMALIVLATEVRRLGERNGERLAPEVKRPKGCVCALGIWPDSPPPCDEFKVYKSALTGLAPAFECCDTCEHDRACHQKGA